MTTGTSNERQSASSISAARSGWRVVVNIVMSLLLFFAVPLAINAFQPRGMLTWNVLTGILIGQSAFLAIFAGLYGKTWIDGFLIGCVVVALAMASTLCGISVISIPPKEVWAMPLVAPGITLSAIGPLLFMRHFFNWKLVRGHAIGSQVSTSLADIFLNIVCIAGVVLAVRAPQVIWGNIPAQYWITSCILGFVIFIISAAVTLPAAALLNCESKPRQFTRLTIITVAVSMAFVGIMWLISLSLAPLPPEFYRAVPLVVIVATPVIYVGIRTICKDGFRLQTKSNAAPPLASYREQIRLRNWRFLQVAIVASLVIVLNVLVGQLQKSRNTVRKLVSDLSSLVGEENVHMEGLRGMTYRPNAKLQGVSIADANHGSIERIIRRVDAADALDDFRELHLTGFGVTDDCLKPLSRLPNLQVLNVSNTQVTGSTFSELSSLPLERLDACELDLARAEWMKLPVRSLRSLSIKESTVAGADFIRFLRATALKKLNLSGVELDDAIMRAVADEARSQLRVVSLAETNLSDSHVALLEGTVISTLNVSATKVTDAGIESIGAIIGMNSLDLSKTGVTDAGVSSLQDLVGASTSFSLTLADTKITGDAFDGWESVPMLLDLSGTLVDNLIGATLVSCQQSTRFGCRRLSLADTNITDAILPQLSKLNCRRIVISGTKLSAVALSRVNAPGIGQWEVGDEQFTEAERLNLEVAGVNLVEEEDPIY